MEKTIGIIYKSPFHKEFTKEEISCLKNYFDEEKDQVGTGRRQRAQSACEKIQDTKTLG